MKGEDSKYLKDTRGNTHHCVWLLLFLILHTSLPIITGCDEAKEHTAEAIREQDSVAMMTSYGVNTMISDSGVIKYRIIAERWEVNEVLSQPRWIFSRGIFLEQFDEKFHTETYIQSDSAYYYTTKRLWYLWGNVRIKTTDGLRFNSEELYWNQDRHELYSNKYSHLVTPEREIEGAYFVSDESMRHYRVTDTKGNFTREDIEKENKKSGTITEDAPTDTTPRRQAATPKKR